ncbi:MAG: ABC transporter substrate-binding protein [Bacillota bacterium]|jgi:ABC-type nitrate/sulfonate/bicarbonate transport system substrate-binding protein
MKRKGSLIILLFILVAGTLIVSSCGGTESAGESQGLKDITVMLDWVPNTNHTGLYVAKEKGWFEEKGLNVEIVNASQAGAAQMVASGEVPFGVSYQEEVTMARSTGVPIVSIAAVIQHNTSGFASLKEDNIVSPKDFENKRYGGGATPAEEDVLQSLMAKYDADYSTVDFVNVGDADWFSIIGKEVDFTWIFYGWTGIEAELRGLDINYIELAKEDPALDYYTPVLITNEDMIKENPDTVKAFLEAVSKGYEYCIANPEESAEILLAAAPELDAELVKASQEYLSGQYQAEASQWGIQKREVWENYAQWLYDHQLIEEMIDVDAAFTNDFLP